MNHEAAAAPEAVQSEAVKPEAFDRKTQTKKKDRPSKPVL